MPLQLSLSDVDEYAGFPRNDPIPYNRNVVYTQIGGDHYTKCAIQPWDFVIANELDYFQGSIIKYVTRWRDKGGVEDLKKAKHFLEKYIETYESNPT